MRLYLQTIQMVCLVPSGILPVQETQPCLCHWTSANQTVDFSSTCLWMGFQNHQRLIQVRLSGLHYLSFKVFFKVLNSLRKGNFPIWSCWLCGISLFFCSSLTQQQLVLVINLLVKRGRFFQNLLDDNYCLAVMFWAAEITLFIFFFLVTSLEDSDNVPPVGEPEILSRLVGRMRGIQGHFNSCYLDATLFR